jgi:hypothetical protein
VPPPPPLPLKPAVQNNNLAKGTSSLLTNARASLKSTSELAPKSEEPTGSMRSTVPADQMVAFLNEIKTIRLRRVHSKNLDPIPISQGTKKVSRTSVLREVGSSDQHNPGLSEAPGSSSGTRPLQTFPGPSSHRVMPKSRGSDHSKKQSPTNTFSKNDDTSTKNLRDTRSHVEERSTTSGISRPAKTYQPPAVSRLGLQEEDDSPAENNMHTSKMIDIQLLAEDPRPHSSRSLAAALINRPINNKLPSLSPQRPRPLGRSRAGWANTSQRSPIDISSDEEDPLMLLGAHQSVPRHKFSSNLSQGIHDGDDPNPVSSQTELSRQHQLRDNTVTSLETELKRTIRAEVERDLQQQARYSEDHKAKSRVESSTNGFDRSRSGQVHQQQRRNASTVR